MDINENESRINKCFWCKYCFLWSMSSYLNFDLWCFNFVKQTFLAVQIYFDNYYWKMCPPFSHMFSLQNIISYIDYWLGKYFLIDEHCFLLKRSAKNWPEGRQSQIIATSSGFYASPFEYQNFHVWCNWLQTSCTEEL